jgi:hypothetical protein
MSDERFTGSSKLDAKQQQAIEEKLGLRYVRIQDMPQYPSRRVRRRLAFRPRSERP